MDARLGPVEAGMREKSARKVAESLSRGIKENSRGLGL